MTQGTPTAATLVVVNFVTKDGDLEGFAIAGTGWLAGSVPRAVASVLQLENYAFIHGGEKKMNPRASAWQVYQLISPALMLCLITATAFSGAAYWAPRTGGQEIEAKSPIHDKWKSLGGARGFLGSPISPEMTAADGVGRYRRYQGGSIYWSPQTGAHEVHGAIRDKWTSLGSESGYGYPITDEVVAPDGRGRYNHFEGGRSIYWTPQTGAHAIFGAIRGKWADLGWENGRLGYPTTDEQGTADGFWRFNHFEHGSIFWSIETGAVDYASGKPGNALGRNPLWGLLANLNRPGFTGDSKS